MGGTSSKANGYSASRKRRASHNHPTSYQQSTTDYRNIENGMSELTLASSHSMHELSPPVNREVINGNTSQMSAAAARMKPNVNKHSLRGKFGTTGKTKKSRTPLHPTSGHNNSHILHFDPVPITADLTIRLKKHPQITFVPFCIPLEYRASKINDENVSHVPLPFPLKHQQYQERVTDIWPIIEKQLRAVESFCRQSYSPTNIIYSTVNAYYPNAQQMSNFGMLSRPDITAILLSTLPIIAKHALELPQLVQTPIPYLASGESKTIYLNRRLCCSLLANAFFCTFPSHFLADNMPDFNFFRLYDDTKSARCEVKKEKLKCILNYFSQINTNKQNSMFLNQLVSFERRCVPRRTKWGKQDKVLCNVKVEPNKKIEQAANMLQVDFANKLVGGGVLNDGSVMEEIRFATCPELIVSRLFTQALADDEVLVITGAEMFSLYTGYSTSFKFEASTDIGRGQQLTDNFGRTYTQLVTMDATYFKKSDPWKQFQKPYIDRDLHKCKVAFIHGRAVVSPVATGNWGCGAFNGNPQLKFLIQWIAATQQGRPFIQYHTNGDLAQGQELSEMCTFIRQRNITIGQLYQVIVDFIRDPNRHQFHLFSYVKSRFSG